MGEELNYQHKGLASGRWNELSISVQMANIGSEVSRALNWQKKDNQEYCLRAASRSIDLLDLSLNSAHPFPAIKELARLREALVDYFYGSNQFRSSEILWRKYFDHFNYAARREY